MGAILWRIFSWEAIIQGTFPRGLFSGGDYSRVNVTLQYVIVQKFSLT